MKALNQSSLKMVIPIMMIMGSILTQARFNQATAQAPDCATGTVMYAIFNDSSGSTTNMPSEIRAVNYATGAVGPLMGGVKYLIQKAGPGGPYYGSAALGVDPITKRFYVMTQMGSGAGMGKDIITINTLTATATIIGTTPNVATANVPKILDDYHFVKVAIAPSGVGYAIGVHRDTTAAGFNAAQCNPVISFTTCGGAPVPNCSTIKLLGFLPYTGNHYHQFNGDIAFDNAGNLYFATAAFARVGGKGRYTDARLYRVAAANIPLVPGLGTIPMTLVANYNTLDSTVVNGIALDPLGAMYISTRRFPAGQNAPALFVNEVYKSTIPGTAVALPGFTVPTAGYSIADVGGCYFPAGVLAQNQLTLSANNVGGMVSLKWKVNNNDQAVTYEVQRSDDDANFQTIYTTNVQNKDHSSEAYTSFDAPDALSKSKFYRICETMKNGDRYYSNVVKVNLNFKINLIDKPNPNPFADRFSFSALLRADAFVKVSVADQDGRIVYQKMIKGQTGSNKFSVANLSGLKPGVYLVEIRVEDEVIREKLIKQ